MATNRDYKRTAESKTATNTLRTYRRNKDTEQRYTAKSFDRLLKKGL